MQSCMAALSQGLQAQPVHVTVHTSQYSLRSAQRTSGRRSGDFRKGPYPLGLHGPPLNWDVHGQSTQFSGGAGSAVEEQRFSRLLAAGQAQDLG